MKNVREKVVCQAILYHLDFLMDCLWTSKGTVLRTFMSYRFFTITLFTIFHYYITLQPP